MNRRQTLLGWAAITAGFVAIAAAWGQVQGTHVVAVQLSYMTSGGLTGLGLIALGTGLIRADDTRAIRQGVEELLDRVNDLEHDVADTKDWLQTMEVKRIQSLAVPEISLEDGAGSTIGR
ncbi:MAG TPA: hypothetical protein VJS45_15885 [Acidimicrobiia bacterium]|nr:hypothetical protein [Acidimicrobiia bacterium]